MAEYGFPKIRLLGFSVNRGNLPSSSRHKHSAPQDTKIIVRCCVMHLGLGRLYCLRSVSKRDKGL